MVDVCAFFSANAMPAKGAVGQEKFAGRSEEKKTFPMVNMKNQQIDNIHISYI